MVSTTIKGFCKSEDCPSSNELLDYQSGAFNTQREREILEHLEACEFCAAEVDLYSRFPQDDAEAEGVESTRIPAPLFELAEALLKKKDNDPSSLDSLLKENGLVLDKA